MKSINLLKKIILKLDNKSLFTAVIFFIISLIQSLTDILLIVSLIPLLAKISDSSLSIGFERFIYIYWENFLGFFNISGVWFIAGITGLINAFIKMVAYYFGLKFALEATSVIAQKVFKSRIYRPFNQFINESISGFQAEITYIDLLETQIFRNFSRMINCVISLLIVSFGILLIDGKSFLTISLILLFIYLLISNVSSNAAYKFGTRKALQREGMFRLVNEIFSNIKSIILFDLRRLKLDKLTRKERKYRRACLWIILLSIQPRFLIEGISLFLICSWGAWLNYSSGFNQAILTVGTLIFAFKRLLPDMQQIYISYSQYKASKYVLDLILERLETKEREDFMLKDKINNYKHDVKIKLNLKNVGYECNFNEKNIQLLNSASIRIKNGDSLLITGKSGSGKSTLLNIISGLQKHTSGEIFAEIDRRWHTDQPFALGTNTMRSFLGYLRSEYAIPSSAAKKHLNSWMSQGLIVVEIHTPHLKMKGLKLKEGKNV